MTAAIRPSTILVILLGATAFYAALYQKLYVVIVVTIAVVFSLISLKDKRYLFVGWFLLAPYFYIPPIVSNLTHNLFVPFVAVLILGNTVYQHKKLVMGKEDVLYFVFLIFLVISSFISSGGPYDDFKFIYVIYFLPFVLYVVARNIDIDLGLLKLLVGISIFHLAVLSILCFFEWRTGQSLFTGVLRYNDVGMGRIAGPFGSPFILGVFVTFISLYIYLGFKLGLIPMSVFLVSLVLSGGLFVLTFTRAVYLGAAAAFLYLIFKDASRMAVKLVRLAAFAGLIYFVGASLMASPEVANRISNQGNADFRIVMAYASIRMFLESPIVGWGVNTFDTMVPHFIPNMLGIHILKDTSHVTILTLLAELGVAGTTLLLLFFYSSATNKTVKLNDLPTDSRMYVIVNIAFLVAFGVNAFLIDMRFFPLPYAWLFLSLGINKNLFRRAAQL